MKQLFLFVLAIFSLTASAQRELLSLLSRRMQERQQWLDPNTDITWSYAVKNAEACVMGVNSVTNSITIPSSIGNRPVTSIGKEAFRGCNGLTSVTIPSSVTSIGDDAFGGCSELTRIDVDPANPSFISSNRLLLSKDGTVLVQGINGDVTIPSSVTSIGKEAFRGCNGLTSVTIPSSVTSIGDDAFWGCSELTRINVDLANPSFISSNGLLLSKDEKTLIRSVNGDVTIPSSVTRICSSAFSCCSGLTSVTIPSSVTNIGESAFLFCGKLAHLAIPPSVTSIGRSAFGGCIGLTSVTISSSVTSIEKWAFSGCYNVRDVTVPGWKCEIGFMSVTNLVISEGTTNIDTMAFGGCIGLTSVTIPSSVTSIGLNVFGGCSGLMRIDVDPANPNYISSNGLLLTKDGTTLIQGVNGDVKIPSGVTSIGGRAFSGFGGLTSVMIPSSVVSIGNDAFLNCCELTHVCVDEGDTARVKSLYKWEKNITFVEGRAK